MPLPPGESLTVEFKSDRKRLRDDDLVLAVVGLANTDGGTLYLGVEDDGVVTGLHAEHGDPMGLASLVAHRTVPPLSVRVEILDVEGGQVAAIAVPRSHRLVATSSGTLHRRRLLADGRPENVPFLPHEFATRQSDLGLLDYSALVVTDASRDDLDPVERHRLRRVIQDNAGDKALLDLADDELDGALGLVRQEGNRRVPTVAGLLLIGKVESIRRHIATHEVAFQVLDDLEVRVNDFYRLPLLACFERVEEQFLARLEEQEILLGLARIPVPRVDRRAFREAVFNAFQHRDYTRLGAVHVQWTHEKLSVGNPGGFMDGVTPENLLVVDPTPRNPLLADAFKRIGMVERTGRGVDVIYRGQLRYGRPAPSYARSTSATVAVDLATPDADIAFLTLVLEEERRLGRLLPIDQLITLTALRSEHQLTAADVAPRIQKDPVVAAIVLDQLVDAGLVKVQHRADGAVYALVARVARRGTDDLARNTEAVREHMQAHGWIRRQDVMALCGLTPDRAKRLLQRLVAEGLLVPEGTKKGRVYGRGPNM